MGSRHPAPQISYAIRNSFKKSLIQRRVESAATKAPSLNLLLNMHRETPVAGIALLLYLKGKTTPTNTTPCSKFSTLTPS